MYTDNATPNKEVMGTDDADNIKNSGAVVKIYAHDGKDTVNNSANLVTISAGAGNDEIYNTGSNVEIYLDDGDDNVYNPWGYSGTDVKIYGGAGKDVVNNKFSKVSIYGGADNDSIYNEGSYTKDIFISGDEGNDYISNRANSKVTISGGAGNDTISNYSATEISIYGGSGNDSIYNFGHNVTINGGAGSDKISLTNDSNKSVIQYTYGDGDDTVFGFNGDETLQITTPKDFETMKGGNDIYFIFDNGSITLKNVSSANVVTISGGNLTTPTEDTQTSTTTSTNDTQTSDIGSTTTTASSTTTTTTTTTTTATTETATTSATNQTTQAAETSASVAPTIINNNYYGDTYNIDGNSGSVVIGSSVSGGVTNNTNIDNSKNIVISGNTWTYSGGDKVINNYQQGEVVKLASDYQGIDLKENSFFVKSSSGQLEIQNARDKFIGYGAGSEDVIVYSYVAGASGAVDGRGRSQAEIMIGAENSNNQIYAGSGGSSMWGGMGGTDIMTGGDGYDEFFYALGGGSDVIQNSGDNDMVNLLGVSIGQIASYSWDNYSVNLQFTDGGSLRVEGNSSVGYQVENQTFVCNQSTGQWSVR